MTVNEWKVGEKLKKIISMLYQMDNKKLYKPWPANNSKKFKYWVYVKSESGGIKKIGFGAKGYQQYHDPWGYYSSLDHNDSKRRKRYVDRHKTREDWNDKNSRGYWAKKLW